MYVNRIGQNGAFKVFLEDIDILAFNLHWPTSVIICLSELGFPKDGFFEFDSKGNLVDASDNLIGEGAEYLAICKEAQDFGKQKLGLG